MLETEIEYLKGFCICIEDTKSLHKKLSKLDKKSDFIISVGSDVLYFSDKYQIVQVDNVVSRWPEYQFVTEDVANQNIKSKLTAETVFIKEVISKKIVNRVKRVSRKLNTRTIKVGPEEDDPRRGYLLLSNNTSSGSPAYDKCECKIKLKQNFLFSLGNWDYFQFSNMPFIFDKSDMVLNCYNTEDKNVIITFSTVVDGLFIKLYARALFIVENEE
jgi:hypothetical protein